MSDAVGVDSGNYETSDSLPTTEEEPLTGDDSGIHDELASSSMEGCNDNPQEAQQPQTSNNGSEADGPASSGVSRQKNLNKMKLLVRSHALREAASPPPELPSTASPVDQNLQEQDLVGDEGPEDSSPLYEEHLGCNRLCPRALVKLLAKLDHFLVHFSNQQLRCAQGETSQQLSVDSSTSMISFSLSRDSSTELSCADAGSHSFTDNTGVDLFSFIVETLHRNYKDRSTLLRIEQDMIALVHDSNRTCHRFPAMSSYHRMLVHRVAAYFGMEHNVDQSGKEIRLQF